ncbi:MAG: hypothetical protein K2J08_04530 [Ruminococcus sp.]|nr:hypothetical protein [Ruminococcus sp.]
MKIMNIHGYKGSAENSAFNALKNLGHEVVSPCIDYDSGNAYKIYEKIRKIFVDSNFDCVVGTSLGGFFALYLATNFYGVKYFLVNPCVMPFLTLPRLEFEENITEYIDLFHKFCNLEKSFYGTVSAVIGGDDEIIDYHDFTQKIIGKDNCIIVPDGKHSGATLNLEYYFERLIK